MIGGRRDAGGCEGGHVSVRKGTRIDGAWAIGLKDDETVSRGQSEGCETGDRGETRRGRKQRMRTIRRQGRGRVRGNLAPSVQVVVVQVDSLENEGEREGESREDEEIPPGRLSDVNVRGNSETDE